MEIIITQWALDSYLNLKHGQVFDASYYRGTLRPDVMLLKRYPNGPKFQNGKFWSLAKQRYASPRINATGRRSCKFPFPTLCHFIL